MKSYPISEIQVDSYFSAPVYLDDDYILLTPEIPVSEELMQRLMQWKYTEVFTDGSPSKKPIESGPDEDLVVPTLEDDTDLQELQQETTSLYFNLLSFTEGVFNTFQSNNHLDIGGITQKIKEMIDSLKKDRDLVLSYPSLRHPVANYLITHSVNTTFLALAIGEFLKLPPHRLIELGIASFLHDLGMMKLPASIYINNRALTDRERQTIQTHPTVGYRILKPFSVAESVALGVLEHQERYNASGYPKKLKGDDISLYARIISVTCSYDAIISNRPFREGKNGHLGILDLLKTNRELYDERILKSLVYCLSLYPLGTYVVLNNNTKGIVHKTDVTNPRFPFVKILVDENGSRVKEQLVVKTSQEKNISIVRVLEPDEIKSL